MPVGEGEIILPIVRRQIVRAVTQVVADEIADGVIHWRLIIHTEPGFAEKAINRLGVFRRQKFTAWISPFVA